MPGYRSQKIGGSDFPNSESQQAGGDGMCCRPLPVRPSAPMPSDGYSRGASSNKVAFCWPTITRSMSQAVANVENFQGRGGESSPSLRSPQLGSQFPAGHGRSGHQCRYGLANVTDVMPHSPPKQPEFLHEGRICRLDDVQGGYSTSGTACPPSRRGCWNCTSGSYAASRSVRHCQSILQVDRTPRFAQLPVFSRH